MSTIWSEDWVKDVHTYVITTQTNALIAQEMLEKKSETVDKQLDKEILYNIRCQVELAAYMVGLARETLEVQLSKAKKG